MLRTSDFELLRGAFGPQFTIDAVLAHRIIPMVLLDVTHRNQETVVAAVVVVVVFHQVAVDDAGANPPV